MSTGHSPVKGVRSKCCGASTKATNILPDKRICTECNNIININDCSLINNRVRSRLLGLATEGYTHSYKPIKKRNILS